ncbi:bifunctional metallophosphatase/5'-nucleotidase [Metabacillus arenae]|nr:5'-nucleotidase C-terminal domain-containing protein [Metabacillus arenae]
MNQLKRILCLTLALCIFSTPGFAKQDKERYKNRYIPVQILGINDFHGQINTFKTVNGKPAGGAAYMAAYLKQREAEVKNSLLVHAGDVVGASAPASALLQDEPTIEILNELKFDVGTIGNHEFDDGYKAMFRLINGGKHKLTGDFEGAEFPYTAANVLDKKSEKPILPPYVIKKVNGMRIGFIGVVTTETPSIVLPEAVSSVKFIDEAKAINDAAKQLKKKGVKSIVVLAHVPVSSNQDGTNPSGELAEIATEIDDEVDILVGGHSHQFANTVVDDKLIVQSYSSGTAFSDIDLKIDPKTKDIVEKKAEIVTTFHEGIKPHKKIQRMVQGYEEQVGPFINEVVGTAEEELTRSADASGESVLGNFIADVQREAMKTDFAFMNPGGIRDNLYAGEITWGELYNIQPFNNSLVKMTLTGEQIKDLLEQQWQEGGSKILQISGLTYNWNRAAPIGEKIGKIQTSEGKELLPNQEYTVTVNNFLAGGGDGFTVLTNGSNVETGPIDLDALVNYIKKAQQPIKAPNEDRIKLVD